MIKWVDETQIAAVRQYGRELGFAFQIVDDVLDVSADEGALGKPETMAP
jgi:geranylgeranyl pyrophosphate synthase